MSRRHELDIVNEDGSKETALDLIHLEAVEDDKPATSAVEERHLDTAEDNDKPAAPDGGYGWFVVLGCFIFHLISGGIERSDGVFFLQFVARFDQSAQLTSWPGAIMSTLTFCLGPIAGAICNRYSVRTSAMLGGLLMTAGCILNGYATNFYFLFFSHALLMGVGRGLSYAPGLILVAMYFEKRRGLAVGIGTSGVGVGTFLLVPTTQVLFDNYGFRGAFLILGGIAFNSNLSAMLYRPLSMHYRFTKRSQNHAHIVDHVETSEAIVASETISEIGSRMSLRLKPTGSRITQGSQSTTRSRNKNTGLKETDPFLGSNYFTTALKICFPTEMRKDGEKTDRKLCHFSLLKNTSFLLYCLSTWLFSMAMRSGYMFIPALVKSKGISDSKASLVLSITGVVDCVSRIGAGLLLDWSVLRLYRLHIYTVISLTLACVLPLLPSMDSFESFLVLSCVFGLFTAVYISQRLLILVDILGIRHMAHSLGILICFHSLGTLLGPPLSGAVKDYLGTFAEAFYLSGVFMAAAGVLAFASSMFLRIQRRLSCLQETIIL